MSNNGTRQEMFVLFDRKNIISNKVYQALRHIPFIVRIPRKLVFNALSGCKLSF